MIVHMELVVMGLVAVDLVVVALPQWQLAQVVAMDVELVLVQ